MDTLLVTGGAGFVGSALVRQLIGETDSTVINVDSLTYAGSLETLEGALNHPRHVFERVDIRDRDALGRLFAQYRPDAVLHLAAETHVDRSIAEPAAFIETNVNGTANVLEAARALWSELEAEARRTFRVLHVSTDEVYGDLGPDDAPFSEATPCAPNSPYAASKAAADHLVRAWHRTYGLPVLITRSCNNYGPWQVPEKLIPLMVANAVARRPLPVYGTGANVREWVHVDDHCRALRRVLEAGAPGRIYNVGGHARLSNIEIVEAICAILDRRAPRGEGSHAGLVQFVADRPGHDRRYAVDDERIGSELGWQRQESFDAALEATVRWYLEHPEWIEPAAAVPEVARIAGER